VYASWVNESTALPRSFAGKGLAPPPMDLLILALILTLIGFGFKVAAAPFHLWALMFGAPGPKAAFIASGSR
jgi:NADH-quinone oxidoreductase subunit N